MISRRWEILLWNKGNTSFEIIYDRFLNNNLKSWEVYRIKKVCNDFGMNFEELSLYHKLAFCYWWRNFPISICPHDHYFSKLVKSNQDTGVWVEKYFFNKCYYCENWGDFDSDSVGRWRCYNCEQLHVFVLEVNVREEGEGYSWKWYFWRYYKNREGVLVVNKLKSI